MDKDEQLLSVTRWRKKPKPGRTTRLGDAVEQLMETSVSPRQARFGPVAELWNQLLPAELCRHCKIDDISGGQLKVLVDLPPYMHELRLCSSELLEQLQLRCPRARIKEIKFVIG
ncbi:MAG TPA: DUF721 domain-containing protein [Phycisphaerales bacterium]|nr:DUF721 domain-containing protein [Phycisphaerales bacterium]